MKNTYLFVMSIQGFGDNIRTQAETHWEAIDRAVYKYGVAREAVTLIFDGYKEYLKAKRAHDIKTIIHKF